MKFSTAIAAAAIASVAVAAPAPSGTTSAATTVETDVVTVASGTVNCDPSTKLCTVACGADLSALCTLVGAFDSVFYGLEVLAGLDISCTTDVCTFTCTDAANVGSALCGVGGVVAVFDSTVAMQETVILNGIETELAQFLSGAIPTGLPPILPSGLPSVPSGLPSVPSGLPALPSGLPSLPGLPSGVPSVPSGLPTGLGSLTSLTGGADQVTNLLGFLGL